MATRNSTPSYPCRICGEEVSLEACKTDDHGRVVHELCYALRLAVNTKAVPEYVRHNFSVEKRRSWKEVAMDVMAESDRGRFQELVGELDDALAAQALGDKWQSHVVENNPCLLPRISQQGACEKIVDAAVRVKPFKNVTRGAAVETLEM